MGAVVCKNEIYDTVVNSAPATAIEFFHGYTYTGHPIAAAAACATLDVYRDETLFERAAQLTPHFENEIHKLDNHKYVKDVRNLGLVGGIELHSRDGQVGARAYEVFVKCYEAGVLIRVTGDIIAISPPLIINEAQISEIFDTIARVLDTVA